MIKTNDLAYQYPGSAPIRFPDISVGTNSPLLICGESGCGKTTLLHLLAGLRRPTSGEVIIDDQSVSALAPAALDQYRGKNIGIVYQQAYFVESLSLLDNLLLSPYAKSREKAQDLLTRFGIGDLLHRYPNQLSVGQQQRASIARAVMNEPSVLLADEPTSALDNKNCKLVIELLMEEAKSQDAALVIVTHDDRLRQEIKESIDLAAIASKTF